MTYVTGDGQVFDARPWGVSKVVAVFWGFIDLIVAFFSTMIKPLLPDDSKPSNNFRQGGSSRGGGGGGGGGGFFGGGGGGRGPRGPPRPPPRRGPNIHGMGDIRGPPPTSACGAGGCCG